MALTKKQAALVFELSEIAQLFKMDVALALAQRGKWKSTYLEVIKRELVRGKIVHWYTYRDELLACRIARYFFGKSKRFQGLWRTKRFKRFNHYVLDQQALLQKLRFAREIKPVPREIVADIERLNSIRNGMAHSFFPENRRAAKLQWKGKDLFFLDGARAMSEDMRAIIEQFYLESRP